MTQLSIQSIAGTLIATLGVGVMLGWLLGRPFIVRDVAMVFSTAFCLRVFERRQPRPRLARLATIVINSAGSTGLGTCIWKPARIACIRSSERAYAVNANAGVLPP